MGGPRGLSPRDVRYGVPAEGGAPPRVLWGRLGAERGSAALRGHGDGDIQRGAARLLVPPPALSPQPPPGGVPPARGATAWPLGRHGRQQPGRHLRGWHRPGGDRGTTGTMGQLERPMSPGVGGVRAAHPPGAAPARGGRHRVERHGDAVLSLGTSWGHGDIIGDMGTLGHGDTMG